MHEAERHSHLQLPLVAPDTVLIAHKTVAIPNERKLELESFIYSFRSVNPSVVLQAPRYDT